MSNVLVRMGAAVAVAWLALVMLAVAATHDPAPAGPKESESPALTAALGRLQSGDGPGAAAMLETLTRDYPQSAQVWRSLGTTRMQLKEPDKAIEAFRHALQIEPDSPQVFYNMGLIEASRGNTGEAFGWLGRARASQRYDMTRAVEDPELGPLRKDPRFAALLPKPEEFEHPFVEPVKIIHEWRGEAAGDQFGWIARDIGDIDGDGVHDFVTSAPTHGGEKTPGTGPGRIYVYSSVSGKLLWSADGGPGEELGTGVEAAGDTNCDGIPDVIASGPGGAVARVYSGKDGGVMHTWHSPDPNETFGNHASGIGDVDGDGCSDVIVGAPGKQGENKIPGRAYVYSGKTGNLLLTLEGERPGDEFGSTVAGRVSGSHRYIMVGAPRAGPRHTGRVYIYDSLTKKPRQVIDSDETGAALGLMFLSVVGDVDADGETDFYLSDWSNSARGPSTGRIYVHSGLTGRRLLSLTGESSGDDFGIGPGLAGDVDGDGHADLIIGAWQYGKVALSGGRTYLYSGRTGRVLRTYTDRVPGDTFGFDAVGMGDVDGDGDVDFLITAAWSAVHGHHSGRVFLISSGVSGKAAAN